LAHANAFALAPHLKIRSAGTAVITLIEKKGKDHFFGQLATDLLCKRGRKNYMSKAIATRVKNVLPNIIYLNETGFIEDRYIGETVRSIFHIMDLRAEQDIPGLLIFIDFQKAIDSLGRNLLLRCLESFNAGPNFIRCVATFHKNIQSCIINNSITSDYLPIE